MRGGKLKNLALRYYLTCISCESTIRLYAE